MLASQVPACVSDTLWGGISEEKFEELMRMSKAAYEEATQSRRERLQKSVSGKHRDCASQRDWKNKLIQYYQRADLNNSGNITCMMLNQSFPGDKVIAAHLWDRSTNGLDLPHDFGLPIDSIDSERNGILVAKGIEDAWTYDRVAFIYNSLATPPVYFMVVLDPTLLEELVEPSPNIKFKDMDGQPLHMPLGIELPFCCLMSFKSWNAVNNALHLWPEYWTDPSCRNHLNFDDCTKYVLAASSPLAIQNPPVLPKNSVLETPAVGIREYVSRNPADFKVYLDGISAETKYLSTISRLVKRENGPDARNRIRKRILQAAENSGDLPQSIVDCLKPRIQNTKIRGKKCELNEESDNLKQLFEKELASYNNKKAVQLEEMQKELENKIEFIRKQMIVIQVFNKRFGSVRLVMSTAGAVELVVPLTLY
ncbi:hypothetical protein PROFUN_13413 [Planoprotostelium fungivorum]|uniref:HNH nuclease domain-containing protein n=1 Tax=Planoprotostelium fungivorum TaxID=1890364 RepID=A0A2P6N3P6_9EUKA|nr:hypothetical protein PROFUN_13413 [Planoprotostelium fungivorum]